MSAQPLGPAIPAGADDAARLARYDEVRASIASLVDGVDDWTAALATAACELHHAFEYFDWTGFYRAVSDDRLVVGPYQGGHGCLEIAFSRGVCGAAARSRTTQLVPDVDAFADHIACSGTTRSEIVVPLVTPTGRLLAVLDVDSDTPAAFTLADQAGLEAIAADLAARFASVARP